MRSTLAVLRPMICLAVVIGAVVAVAGCQPQQNEEPQRNGTAPAPTAPDGDHHPPARSPQN